MGRIWAIAASAGFILGAACLAPAAAQSGLVESVYSRLDLYGAKKSCRKISKATEDEEFGQRWRCAGTAGVDVFVHYEDARDYVAYGRRGKQESNIFGLQPIGAIRENLEWRGRKDAKGKFAPFATISRMGFENDKVDKAEWWSLLVVTRLASPLKNSCVVAYVDGRANADANDLARRAADIWAADSNRPCPASDDAIPYIGKVSGPWKDKASIAAP